MAENPLTYCRTILAAFILFILSEVLMRAEEALPAGLSFMNGAVNGVFIERKGKFLSVYGDPSGQHPAADSVLLTESRRDVTWAARGLAKGGAKVIAPEKEAELLNHPEKFWAELREKRFHDYASNLRRSLWSRSR